MPVDKVRFSLRVTPEFRRWWKAKVLEMGLDSSQEAMRLLVELYEACSRQYRERNLARLVEKVKLSPFNV